MMVVDYFLLSKTFAPVKTFALWSGMFIRVTNKQYVTNWAIPLSGHSCRKEVKSSESHEVSFTRTFQRRKNVFTHNYQRSERAINNMPYRKWLEKNLQKSEFKLVFFAQLKQ